jgi:hypothetical protein
MRRFDDAFLPGLNKHLQVIFITSSCLEEKINGVYLNCRQIQNFDTFKNILTIKRRYVMKYLRSIFIVLLIWSIGIVAADGQITVKINGLKTGALIARGDTLNWTITCPVGATVANELWWDSNNNGILEPGLDKPLYFFDEVDGFSSPTNDGPTDMDFIANGVITSTYALGFVPGKYFFVAHHPSGSDTASFTENPLLIARVTINGTVRTPLGVPIQNCLVSAQIDSGGKNPRFCSEWHALTNSSGDFSITMDSTSVGHLWRVTIPQGIERSLVVVKDTVLVAMGVHSNIDIRVMQAKKVSGRVTDLTGAPLVDVKVNAWGFPKMDNPGAKTGPDGRYALFVPAGVYIVVFEKPGYVLGVYNQKFLPWRADTLVVFPATDSVSNINAQLVRGGIVQGRVTFMSMGVQASVIAHSTSGPNYDDMYTANTDQNGNYNLVVPPGTYYISFHAMNAMPVYFNQKQMPPYDPVIVNTISDTVRGINGNLGMIPPPFKVIQGTVAATNSPNPGVAVVALDTSMMQWGSTMTDSQGKYELHVPSGNFYVFFSKPGFVYSVYNNKTLLWNGNLVSTMISDTVRGIDATLQRGGTINGRLSVDGIGKKGVVLAHDTSAPYSAHYFAFCNENGFYQMVVPPSTYYVSFNLNNIKQIFNHKPSFPGDPVKVTTLNDSIWNINGDFSNATPIQQPEITRIQDVPDDNGKQILIRWKGYEPREGTLVTGYYVERKDFGDWTIVGTVDRPKFDSPFTIYQLVVPTMFDSTKKNGMFLTEFRIAALLIYPASSLYSQIAAGYSVDNRTPAMPPGVMGTVANGKVTLAWHSVPNIDSDIEYYRIYRSMAPIASVMSMTPYAHTTSLLDTSFTDHAMITGTMYYYRVTTVDYSGNESEPGTQIKSDGNTVMGVDRAIELPVEFALAQNYPNPFNPSTVITFDVPNASFVTLKIFNMLGQEITTLVASEIPAGRHTVEFHAKDYPSGLYIYRMTAGAFTSVKKMMLTK